MTDLNNIYSKSRLRPLSLFEKSAANYLGITENQSKIKSSPFLPVEKGNIEYGRRTTSESSYGPRGLNVEEMHELYNKYGLKYTPTMFDQRKKEKDVVEFDLNKNREIEKKISAEYNKLITPIVNTINKHYPEFRLFEIVDIDVLLEGKCWESRGYGGGSIKTRKRRTKIKHQTNCRKTGRKRNR